MMGGGMMGYGGLLSLIINIGVIVGIIFLVVWAVRKFSSNGLNLNQGGSTQSPREILQARYARGEITREQYQQMLSDLG
jgi:putative membrane protein